MSASSDLREATAAVHQSLERKPVAERLASGRIDRTTFLDLLRAVAVLVENFRTVVMRHGTAGQRELLPVLVDWVARIEADIEALATDDGMANPEAQSAALALVQKLYEKVSDDPFWIFGMAYVLFGSHNGNRVVADALSEGLGLEGETGTSYFRASRQGSPAWPAFKQLLNRELKDESGREPAIRGALDTFECFCRIFDALGSPKNRKVHSSAVNPEAGHHPVPADPELTRVATEVGKHCHAAFGYLGLRFGARGEAFARSDGAWLVTLCEISLERAQKRIEWLARLLSSRGIPSICLEYHLSALHRALMADDLLPGDEPDRLPVLANHVGSTRRAVVTDDRWDEIMQTPIEALDPRGTAILVSAIIDQHGGLAPCADSIAEWLRTTTALTASHADPLLKLLESAREATGFAVIESG